MLKLTNNTFEENSAPDGHGGGLSLEGSVDAGLVDSIMQKNQARFGGNIATSENAKLSIDSSHLLSSTALSCGGALAVNRQSFPPDCCNP